jgi:hypothetical protein
LYNWYAVNDNRGLAPVGWHIASDLEWTELTDCLGGQFTAASDMKEVGTEHWLSPNTGATNNSGFTALPGGFADYQSGEFTSIGMRGFWWTSSELSAGAAWDRSIYVNQPYVERGGDGKKFALSVRCIKD